MNRGFLRREYREPLPEPELMEIWIEMEKEGRFPLKVVDQSFRGRGCIYEGSNPPTKGAVYYWTEEDRIYSRVKVCWTEPLEKNSFKLGLRLL